MPKQRITKDMVIEAAFELAREGGGDQVIVKNIAGKLGCSVQPIYSYCSNMETLKQEVAERTGRFFKEYVAEHMEPSDYFKSIGRSYVSLAREEPNLFKMYFMRRREGAGSLEEIYRQESSPQVAEFLAEEHHISLEAARRLHYHMITYTMGISFILASAGPEISAGQVMEQMEEAYEALAARIKGETEETAE